MSSRCVLAALLVLGIPGLPACAPESPPNVVVILIDTLRADHLGCYGYRRAQTPAIDALAGESCVFENAIAQSSWTGPSVASFFTSVYPSRHRMTHFGADLGTSLPTLAGVLRRNGYRTLAVSANFTFVTPDKGFDRGFDRFEVLARPPLPGEKPEIYGVNSVAGGQVTDRAIELLRESRRDPFLLYVHYMDPHSSYDPPQPYRDRFTRGYDGPVDGSTDQIREIVRGDLGIEERDLDQLVSLYDGEVAYVDAEVGRLLDHLREIGAYERSVIALLSDHGEEFLDHGGLFHMFTLHREQIQVPLLIRRPGGEGGGTRVRTVCELIDVGPTLLELAGLDDPRDTSGESLGNAMAAASDGCRERDLARNPDEDPEVAEECLAGESGESDGMGAAFSELHPDALVASAWRAKKHRAALTTDAWSLIASGHAGEFELYDRAADPLETANRAGAEKPVLETLKEHLEAHPTTVWDPPPASDLTDAERKALRALGYAD